MKKFYPFRFGPVYKDYIWGGQRIPAVYNRDMPEGIYAESWEISTNKDGATPIANGSLAGKTLGELLPEFKKELLGSAVKGDDFPLLIKLIDARDVLSVQVHPNDNNEKSVGGEAKTEMWYFLDGGEDASVYCGFNSKVGREDVLEAIKNKSFPSILRKVPAKPGEAVFVPGGRVHAIDKGCLLIEIQQNSNTTYRLYDWDRVDANGKARDLHIDKALKVIDFYDNKDPRCKIDGTTIQKCDYFQLDKFVFDSRKSFAVSGKSFHALFVEKGAGKICWDGGEESLATGQSWLIPANLEAYEIIPDKKTTLLRTVVP